jgi:hypothetical protein
MNFWVKKANHLKKVNFSKNLLLAQKWPFYVGIETATLTLAPCSV